ncbi:MAG: molybdopterin oxidoreductase family protein [Desulfomonilaceae bacterium]
MIDYLALKRFPGSRKPYDSAVHSICQECSTGCGLVAYLQQGRIVDIQGEEEHPVSRGRLCARGIAFWSLLTSNDRLQKVTFRKSQRNEPEEFENWETGLDLLAERLKKSRDLYGPESLLIGCDPDAGLDFYYAALRFCEFWGTPNIFNPLDDPDATVRRSLFKKPCYEWLSNKCFLLVGADPASTHPIAFGWIMEAQKNGAKIVSADNRFTSTMSKADFSLILRPEKENLLGISLMKLLLNDENCNRKFLPEKTLKSFAELALGDLAKSIGVSSNKIEELARLLVTTAPVQIITSKKMAHLSGYGIWEAIADAMGWAGHDGGGWYPLDSGRPVIDLTKDARSSQGSYLAGNFTSYTDIKNLLESAVTNQEPSIRTLICTGNSIEDYFAPLAPLSTKLDTIAYFGVSQNATSKLANLVFPAALWPEKDSLFFTDDRRICWARHLVTPGRNFRSGLDFWTGLADRLGLGEHFPWRDEQGQPDPEAFRNWILAQSPDTSGCNLAPIESQQSTALFGMWPCAGSSLKDPVIPELKQRESLLPVDFLYETPTDLDLYPLYCESPSALARSVVPDFQWMGPGRSDATYNLQLNPEIADALQINMGDTVYLESRYKIVEALAWISRSIPVWMAYSNRPIGEKRVLVYRKGDSRETARFILKDMLTDR